MDLDVKNTKVTKPKGVYTLGKVRQHVLTYLRQEVDIKSRLCITHFKEEIGKSDSKHKRLKASVADIRRHSLQS